MARYYVCPINGLDSNDGLSWSTCKRTLNAAQTLAAAFSGDEVSIAKTPTMTMTYGGSTVNLGWTSGSAVVTLSSELIVSTITTSTGIWVASANCGAATDTTNFRVETASSTMSIGIAFTTGLAAFTTVSTSGIDFSGYDGVSFSCKITCSAAAMTVTAGAWALILCSDASGATAVATLTLPYDIDIPIAASTNNHKWFPLTIYNGTAWPTVTIATALPNSVKSAGLYILSGLSTTQIVNIAITNIIAVNSNNGLNLNRLIGSGGTGEEATWWAIRSISGITMTLGSIVQSGIATTNTLYYGTTGIKAGYSIMPAVHPGTGNTTGSLWSIAIVGGTSPVPFSHIRSGASPDNKFKIIGGYNTATNLVDGITMYEGLTSQGTAYTSSSPTGSLYVSHVNFQNLWFTRYATGFSISGANFSSDMQLDNCGVICTTLSANTPSNITNVKFIKFWANQCALPSATGVGQMNLIGNAIDNILFDQLYMNSGSGSNIFMNTLSNIVITNSTLQGASTSAIQVQASATANLKCYNVIFKNNGRTLDSSTSTGFMGIWRAELYNCSLAQDNVLTNPMSPYTYIYSYNHNQVAGTKVWSKYYNAISDATLTHTSGVSSMKYTPAMVSGTGVTASQQLDLEINPIKVRFKKNQLPATASVWVYPNLNYQGGSINLMRSCTPAFGDISDVILGTLTASVTISVWTGMTVTINPATQYWNETDTIDSYLYVKLNSATPTTTSTISGDIHITDVIVNDYIPVQSFITYR